MTADVWIGVTIAAVSAGAAIVSAWAASRQKVSAEAAADRAEEALAAINQPHIYVAVRDHSTTGEPAIVSGLAYNLGRYEATDVEVEVRDAGGRLLGEHHFARLQGTVPGTLLGDGLEFPLGPVPELDAPASTCSWLLTASFSDDLDRFRWRQSTTLTVKRGSGEVIRGGVHVAGLVPEKATRLR